MKQAYYDPHTDTIHNAVYGTFSYYHEIRHQQQHKVSEIRLFSLYYVYIRYWGSVISIIGAFFNPDFFYGFVFVYLFHFIVEFLLEQDANIYALIQVYKKKKKQTLA